MTARSLGRYVRGLAAPVLLWALFLGLLAQVLPRWLAGEQGYDEQTLREWIDEARVFRDSLPDMVRGYLDAAHAARHVRADPVADPGPDPAADILLLRQSERIAEHLKALGNPPTKVYPGQLPLFPVIYRLEVTFEPGLHLDPIAWDSDLPRHPSQVRELTGHPLHPQARLNVQYQLHAFNKRQHQEEAASIRLRWMGLLAAAATALALAWIYLVQQREAARQQRRRETEQQIHETERMLLEEELRRQEAERLHEEARRSLLEQKIATQTAEREALELKSQMYAGIGIMAGSYAHNIKNLLVRPNDLLRRCLEAEGLPGDQHDMLHEVRHTLGTVTERLQQILRTVRRDPSRPELAPLDMSELVSDLAATWGQMAHERWKLQLVLDLAPGPLTVRGDRSHLQQAVENLLFNARDATFERRNHLRDAARRDEALDPAARRQAVLAAASWRGRVVLRGRAEGGRVLVEVQDNGIGMTEEVRRRCTETHFSTKRDNAGYEGQSTGMGLGLSFVVAILQSHGATLTIESAPLAGALFRLSFPAADPPPDPAAESGLSQSGMAAGE